MYFFFLCTTFSHRGNDDSTQKRVWRDDVPPQRGGTGRVGLFPRVEGTVQPAHLSLWREAPPQEWSSTPENVAEMRRVHKKSTHCANHHPLSVAP